MVTVWGGEVDHLRQECFYFYFQNASTFASLHAVVRATFRSAVRHPPQPLVRRAFRASVAERVKSAKQNRVALLRVKGCEDAGAIVTGGAM